MVSQNAAFDQPIVDEAWTAQQLRSNLARVLGPGVCQELLHELEREDTDFFKLASIIERDPYIAAKVVGLANLARGAGTPMVQSINRAVQILGIRQVQALVLSVMLTGAMLNSDGNVPRRRDLWRWILGCGIAADWLGEQTANSDEAVNDTQALQHLINGLIMGLGSLILYAGLGLTYSKVLGKTLRPLNLAHREKERFGVTHHRVSLWALEAMQCPDELGHMSRILHDDKVDTESLYARAVEVLGAKIAGFESAKSTTWLTSALPKLKIDPAGLLEKEGLRPLRSKLRKMARVLQVDLGHWQNDVEQQQKFMLSAGASLEELLVDNIILTESAGLDTDE